MNLGAIALQNSRITVLAIVGIIALGLTTFLSYPSSEDPTITIRQAQIIALKPGMTPERVEELITDPIEVALRQIAEIDEIRSTSKTGEATIDVDIHDWVADLAPVFQNIRNKMDDVQRSLPSGTVGPLVYDDVGLTAIATIALWADGFTLAEMRDVARDIRKRLYTLGGVKRVELFGVQKEHVYLELSPTKLAQFGVSPQEIFGQLAQQNVIEPGGEIKAGDRSVLVEPSGNFESIDEIRDVVFAIPNSDRIARLDQIVTIQRHVADPPESPVFFNDHPAIILSVSTVDGTNNVEFGARLSALLHEVEQDLLIGYVLEYATFQPELIEIAVQGAVSNVYQTLAIVLVVVMLFLGLGTGLIVGSFVPLTMLLGIIVMRLLEVEFQRMSIAAMIIALGMLVDNGIVVAEDIRVRLARGLDRHAAAIEATRTLALPLLISSLTTIFAFMPMLLVEGSAGEYVRSLAEVVTTLLLASWLLSMTVTPAMCAWFMKVPAVVDAEAEQRDDHSGAMYRVYRAILDLALRARVAFIIVLVLLLVGAVRLLETVPTEFFPLGDRNQLLVYLDFEAGTDIRVVEPRIRRLTEWLADLEANPEITGHVAYIGSGGPRFFLALSPIDPDPHRAFVVVTTASTDDVGPLIKRINGFIDERLPTARADAKRMWFGAGEPGLIEIRVIGADANTLAATAAKITEAFHAVPGTVGIKHDWENKVLKLIVDVAQIRARRAGVSSTDVAQALETTFAGITVSEYRDGDRVLPIVLRGDEDIRTSLSGLQQVQVPVPASNSFVQLAQVADIEGVWQFGRVKRRNQERTLTVAARNPNLPAPDLLAAITPTIAALDLPPGYRVEVGGEIADQAEANGNLFGLLPLALGGIVILLIGQFNSFRKGGIILATIPLILVGGVLGLVVMGAPFSFMVILGFFSLAGILINNGIVLIDRIEIEENAGRTPLDAVVTACLARLRPILMTTLTTVLGLIPLILFGGALFYGMACVIAFGLVVATVFTLGFVPVAYTLLYRIPINRAISAS